METSTVKNDEVGNPTLKPCIKKETPDDSKHTQSIDNEEYFQKYYRNEEEKEEKTVRFKSEVEERIYENDEGFELETQEYIEIDTQENIKLDNQDEFKLDTQEDIKREGQKLLSELIELKLRMKRGEDVRQQFNILHDKFKLIEKIEKMIKLQKELLKNQNSSLEAVSNNNHKDKRIPSPSTLKRDSNRQIESANEDNKKLDAAKDIDESKKTENKEKVTNVYCADNKIVKIVEKLFRYITNNKYKTDDFVRGHLINLKRCFVFDEGTFNKFINKSIQKTTNKTNQENNIDKKYLKLEFSKNDWSWQQVTRPSQQVYLNEIDYKNILNASDFSCNFIAYTYYSLLSYSKIKLLIENIFLDENVNNVQINNPYFNLISIHLTTKFLASKFNEKSIFEIMLPEAYLFKSLKDENYKFVREYPFSFNIDLTNILKEDERAIFAAFSHFTYKYTNKKLMVVGLRGQYLSNRRRLNLDESVIFSSGQTQKYGASDLGDFGIKRFFDNHVCSKLCNDILMKI